MTAPFWDDLYDVEIVEGEIYYYNDAANHRYIVQWDSIAHNIVGNEPVKEIFQVILLNPEHYPTSTGDGEIIFQYKEVQKIDSMTVGIENHSQNIGLQYVFNQDYNATADVLENELAIKFTTEPPFEFISTSDGGYNAGDLIASGFGLEQNRPNPFSSNTLINYALPQQSNVSISVYNINGELVRTLTNEHQATGQYTVEWDGSNDLGVPVNSCIFLPFTNRRFCPD